MSDVIRWITIYACLLDIGVILALYQRIGKAFVPHIFMRLLMIGAVLKLLALLAMSHAELGTALMWWGWLFLLAALLDLASFAGLYWWYGTPKGRAHADRVLHSG
jgi:hypothetical protein